MRAVTRPPCGGLLHQLVNSKLLQAVQGEQAVLDRQDHLQALAEQIGMVQVASADAVVRMLVGVDRTDAPPGRAHRLAVPHLPFAALLLGPIKQAVVGPDEVGTEVDPGIASIHPCRLELCLFFGQRVQVDHSPRAEEAAHLGIKDATGRQVQGKAPKIVDNGVPGVVATLKADDHVGPRSHIVHHAAFALVAPLGTYHYGDSHWIPPLEQPGSPGEQRGCLGVLMVWCTLLVAR